MRELYESCALNSSVSSEKKKNAKFDKSSECTECRCFPPFVKVHHFDCPLVKKQPCPIHGAYHRPGKTDSCMVITLHPNLPNEGWLYPVEASVTGGKTCCSTTKPNVIAYSNKHYYQTRKSLRSQEVQTNLEDIKKSRYFFDGSSYVKAVKYNGFDKSQRFKKMKKCFLSPCGSPAYTSISENAVEDFDIRKSKNVSVQVRTQEDDSSEKMNDSDGKQTLKRYYFNPEKNYLSDKNSIIGVLRSGETECDLFTEYGKQNKQKNFGGKISLFNPYIVYPTMTTTEPVKDSEPPPRKNTYKFEQEEFVGVDHKESFDPSYQDARNKGPKEEMDEGTDDQDQSDSSGSLYFTPFILLPSDLEKNGQTANPTLDENETLENDDVTLDKERPSLHSIATSAIQPMMEDKGINAVDSIPESDSVKLRDATFKTESEDSLVTEKTVVQLNRSENNDVKSVKLKAVMSVSRQPSDEKTVVAQTNKVVEKNWENLQKISFNKNDVSLQMMREVQSKPSTSFKLIQTSISITTTLPQPGCYCSTLIEPDQTKSINSISPSNDTYIVKHFPSIESNPSAEKEIHKWLHKCNSDSKIYSGKKNPGDKSQEAIKEDEECLCDDSCDRSVCPMEENTKTKKESSTMPPAKESKPSSVHPYSNTSQPQSSPFSDLSELRKIIDQGFDRITNEMKEICDCKQRQMTKQEIVELVEREVMNMNAVECPAGQKNLKKEIQLTNETQTTFDLFDKLNENKGRGPTSPNRVNIRQSIAMHESLNPGDVLVCKICANEIKISTKDAYTNTDKEMPTLLKFPKTEAEVKSIEAESFEITNSTILKKITKKEPQPSANTPVSQKLQLSAIPTPHKHHCFDIIDPGVVKKPIHSKPQTQQTQPPWIPTSTYNPKSSNQSNQKSESSTPKSTSPREKKRIPNTYETIKISTPDPSIKSNNSGAAGQAARPKSNASSVHRSNATNKNIQFSTQRPTTKQSQRKNPNNFVAFPVKVSQFRLNQYIRCLQEEAMKRCQAKCAKNSSEDLQNVDKNSENLEEGSVPENSDSDEFDLNEYILLRPTKSDTCSCHYTNRTNGSSGIKKGKEFPLKNPDYFLLQSSSGIETPRAEKIFSPHEKAIKSEEALKKGSRKNGAEKKRKCDVSKESGRSDKTVGDTCQRSGENLDFHCDSTRHGKSEKCFFRELVNCFDSGSHSMNFKERILRSALFSDYPFSNDFDDSSPPEFTEEEEGEAVEEEMLSQKEDSNVEEGD